MSQRKYHLSEQEIPEGFQIFEERLEVAGVRFRKEDATAFATARAGWIELELDPENEHDPNAIKVIGCTKGVFRARRSFIGYVPKEVSKAIAKGGYWDQVLPRLLKTYVGDEGYVEILFQILGPANKKHEFRQLSFKKGGHYTDSVDQIKKLSSEKNFEDAIKLLLRAVKATEKEAQKDGHGVAPWYYEKLAIIYRKQRQYAKEVAVLERLESQSKTLGEFQEKLAERLQKARHLKNGRSTK